jgi:hypothetical protein
MTTNHRASSRRPRSALLSIGTVLVLLTAAGCSTPPGPSGTPGPTATPGPSSTPGPTASPASSPSADPSAAPATAGRLVSVELRGGHCMNGTCGSIVVLETDGRVHDGLEPPNDLGTVPAGDVTGLTDLIASTDFAAIRANAFTGTCPVAFDGQEVVIELTTSSGVERIESCVTEVDLDHPLFEAVAGVLEDFVTIPTYE